MTNAKHDPSLAGRTIGAMFFIAFGGLWFEAYAMQSFVGAPAVLIGIAVVTAIVLLGAFQRYRQIRPAGSVRPAPTATQLRSRRMFNWVNVAQWVAIIVVANLLVHLKLTAWVTPAVVAIVGLHLIPLAWTFSYRAHYLTGAALIGFAIAWPLLTKAGPANPVGCLGAGVILWSSALWALKSTSGADAAPARSAR